MDGLQHEFCPTPDGSGGAGEGTIFIGRTEYTIVMFNSQTREIRWNATFMDYSTHVDQDDAGGPASGTSDYDLRHFASSSTGAVVTMNEVDADVMWTQDYGYCLFTWHLVLLTAGTVDMTTGIVDMTMGIVDMTMGIVDMTAGIVDMTRVQFT